MNPNTNNTSNINNNINNTFNYSLNSFKYRKNNNTQENQNNHTKVVDLKRLFHNKFKDYRIKKHIGTHDNYNLFLINCRGMKAPSTNKKNKSSSICNRSLKKINKKLNKNNSSPPTKLILKVTTINKDNSNSNNTENTTHQQHIIKYLKKNPSTRPFINNCYESKQINNNLFLILQYFDSLSLKEVSPYLLKLNNTNYVTLVQYLVKQILKGLKNIHHKNIPHCNLSFDNIIISHKLSKDVQVKFINFNPPNYVVKKITKSKKQNREGKQNSEIKISSSSKIDKLKDEDISKCGNLLIELIIVKYKDELHQIRAKTDEKRKKSKSSKNGFSLDNIMANIFKRDKTVDDVIPTKLLFYIKTIKALMIDSQTSPKSVIKELLFKEKYQ